MRIPKRRPSMLAQRNAVNLRPHQETTTLLEAMTEPVLLARARGRTVQRGGRQLQQLVWAPRSPRQSMAMARLSVDENTQRAFCWTFDPIELLVTSGFEFSNQSSRLLLRN